MTKVAANGALFMKRVQLIALLAVGLVAAFIAAGCGSDNQSVGANDVAVVGDQPITKEQFDQLIDRARDNYAKNKQDFPAAGTPQYVALRRQAMQFLVQREQFEQRAEDLGLKICDSDVEKQMLTIKSQYFGKNGKCDAACEKKYQRRDQEAGRHRRAGARRRASERRPEQDLREGHRRSDRLEQGSRGVLQEEQAELHPAGEPRRAPHPRQEEGARREPLPAREKRRELRGAGEEVLDRPGHEEAGRKAPDLEGPAGARVRQGRVRAQDGGDLAARQDVVRLAHHPRAQRDQEAEGHAALRGEARDPSATAPAGEDGRDEGLGRTRLRRTSRRRRRTRSATSRLRPPTPHPRRGNCPFRARSSISRS